MWTLIFTPLRIVLALFVSLALAATLWKAYVMGQNDIQQKWDKQTTTLALETLKQSEKYRAKEQQAQINVTKVQNEYAAAKKLNANLARGLTDSLRELQATLDSAATSNAPTPSGAHGAGIEYQLLGNCAGNLVGISAEAQRLAGKVIGLQNYINAVKP